jgi:hypothetical protein
MVSNGATAVLEKAPAMAPFSNLLPLGPSFSLKPDFLLLFSLVQLVLSHPLLLCLQSPVLNRRFWQRKCN